MGEDNQRINFSVFLLNSQRLDRYLGDVFSMSRVTAKAWIRSGRIQRNNKTLKPADIVTQKDELMVALPKKSVGPIVPHAIQDGTVIYADEWVIPILYSDDHLMVINKPVGLIVHGGPGIQSETLVDILMSAGVALADVGHDRFGIVHRLDQFTEGLMVIAKSKLAYDGLQTQFKDRRVQKHYYAVLKGVLRASEGVIDYPIGRDVSVRARQSCRHFILGTEKDALTEYMVIRQWSNVSFVDVRLITGRTHQIRVHFSALNCPVLGDALYSRQTKKGEGYYLQSYRLTFDHPVRGNLLEFQLPVSSRLKNTLATMPMMSVKATSIVKVLFF